MSDPNMELAYQLSQIWGTRWASNGKITRPWYLKEFKTPESLTQFLDKHDKKIARNIFKIHKALMQIADEIEGRDLGTILCLWSGCITGAKLVALKTKDGPVTAEYRRSASMFNELRCKLDPTWKIGYQAGPILKKLRKEPVCLDGVIKKSSLRARGVTGSRVRFRT